MASTITFGQIIDEVLSNLHGQTSDFEQMTYLSTAAAAGDTTIYVGDASQISNGLVEIDDELMWVTSVDRTNNLFTVAPGFGRGFGSTTAVSHPLNARVVNNPRFPRSAVEKQVNATILSMYPDIFVLAEDESNVALPVQISYPVPAACDVVIDVRWSNIGPSKLWVPVRRWKLDPKADTTAFSTGKSLEIYDGMVPGRTIKVTYVSAPTTMSAEMDLLSSTGLADNAKDVLVYGACYRLIANLEIARLQTFSVEQSERSILTPPGSATQASRYYLALYEQAFQREAARLQKLLPNRTHLVR